jgi:hypothetical protein
MKLFLAALASSLALASAANATTTTVVVAGTSDPFLAGAPIGGQVNFNAGDVVDVNTDTALADSPYAFGVTAGQWLTISAVNDPTLGSVGNCPGCTSDSPAGGDPIGSSAFTTTGFTALVSGFSAPLPINSLVGLFDSGSPSVFEIGNGGSFLVPTGATTLYLGTVDGYQWNNNVGAYDVTLSVPEPATWAMMLFGIGAVGAGMRMNRRRQAFTTA